MSPMGVRRTPATTVLIVVALVALAGCGRDTTDTSASTSQSPSESQSPTTPSSPSSPTPSPQTATLPVYYVGDQPTGPRLFREFRQLQVSSDRSIAALSAALSSLPLDPDYRTDWPAGTAVTSVDSSGSKFTIDLTNSAADLTKRPPNVTA